MGPADVLEVHRQPLEAVGDLGRHRVELDPAGLLEVGELGDLHPVHPHLPPEPPCAQARALPVVLDEPHVVLLDRDPDRPQRVEVDVLHVVGRRLQDDLVLVVLLEAVRVLGVAAVVGPDGRLHVGGPPRLRAEHAKQRRRIRRPRADLGVVRLDDDAPLLLPEGLKGRDHPLEGRRHRRRKLSAGRRRATRATCEGGSRRDTRRSPRPP